MPLVRGARRQPALSGWSDEDVVASPAVQDVSAVEARLARSQAVVPTTADQPVTATSAEQAVTPSAAA